MGQCKINCWEWTLFSFVLHMVPWRSVLVMVPTIFDKTQARARKSKFSIKSFKMWPWIICNWKIPVLIVIRLKNEIDFTCRLETSAIANLGVKMCLVVPKWYALNGTQMRFAKPFCKGCSFQSTCRIYPILKTPPHLNLNF